MFNGYYKIMQGHYFFYRKRIKKINFDFCKIVRKNISDATFWTDKIPNSAITSVIFFTAKQC